MKSVALWVLLLALHACRGGSGGGGGTGDAGGFVPADGGTGDAGGFVPAGGGTPRRDPPSQRGFLDVAPKGLILRAGDTVQLDARAFDSLGAPIQLASVLWTSSQTTVLSIDGQGRAQALAEGFAEITATDGARETIPLGIVVLAATAAVPLGPTGITFTPPVLQLQVGQEQAITYTLNDASGQPVTGVNIDLLASNDAIVVNLGRVRAIRPGVALITARDPAAGGNLLPGTLVVTIVPAYAPSNGPVMECDPSATWPVVGCMFSGAPAEMSRPGLASSLRVRVARQQIASSCFSFIHWRAESPDRIDWSIAGVVALDNTGLLAGVAAGITTLRPSVEGISCGESRVVVNPDLRGTWAIQCSNGDQGRITLSTQYGTVARAGSSGFGQARASGDSVVCNPATAFACTSNRDNPSSGYASLIAMSDRLCSRQTPCRVVAMGHCGQERQPAGEMELHGPGLIRSPTCEYSIGGKPAACTPPPPPCRGPGQSCDAQNICCKDPFEPFPHRCTNNVCCKGLRDVCGPSEVCCEGTICTSSHRCCRPAGGPCTGTVDMACCSYTCRNGQCQ